MYSIGCRQSRCAISTSLVFGLSWSPQPLRNFGTCFFFAAPLPRSSPPLSSFNRCFPGAISAATCCAIPTHGFLAPLSRHIHCVVATHLSTSSPLGRHIRCAISTSVILKNISKTPPVGLHTEIVVCRILQACLNTPLRLDHTSTTIVKQGAASAWTAHRQLRPPGLKAHEILTL